MSDSEADLIEYLRWVGPIPHEADQPLPLMDVRVREGTFARELTWRMQFTAAFEPPLEPPLMHSLIPLPTFHREHPSTVTHAPEWQLAAALRLLRPGFFGLVAQDPQPTVELVERTEREACLRMRLPPARAELVTALVRGLCGFALESAATSIVVQELGHPKLPSLPLQSDLQLPPLPFALRSSRNGSSSLVIEVRFQQALSPEALRLLADLTRAFEGLLKLGLLPGADSEVAGAEPRAAYDSLADQWTIEWDEFRGKESAIYPLIEGLASLHARFALVDVELL